MDAKIKDGFTALAKERETLTKLLNDKGDIGTKRLKWWPLFNTTCVIAATYSTDKRKKLKLEIASGYLNDAKSEMEQYGIGHFDFLNLEKALKAVMNTINKLTIEKYKSSVSEVREEVIGSGVEPMLKK